MQPPGTVGDQKLCGKYLLILGAVALLVRLALFVLVYLVQKRTIDVVGGGDAGAYMAMAHDVFVTGSISGTLFLPRPFLFPALAGVLYHVVGEQVLVILFLNMGMNVLTCLLVYCLARTIGQSPRIALVAGLIAAVYPAMLLSSVSFMTEAQFLLFYTLALLLFARFVVRPNWRDLLLSTATLALATLTRLVVLPLPFLFVGLIASRSKAWLRYAAIFLLAAVVPAGILSFRNWYYSGIPTFSTEGQWALLFMRATSSERRVTNEEPGTIYARYIQEIERRLGHPVPPLESIPPEAIWQYFQPTPAMQTVISQMAVEKNLAYPQWYILNSFYGLHRILSFSPDSLLPTVVSVPLHYGFVVLACVGLWDYWKRERRWAWMLGIPALTALALNIALQTAVVDTRHGLAAALPMFILASNGLGIALPSISRWTLASRRARQAAQGN